MCGDEEDESVEDDMPTPAISHTLAERKVIRISKGSENAGGGGGANETKEINHLSGGMEATTSASCLAGVSAAVKSSLLLNITRIFASMHIEHIMLFGQLIA